MFSGSTSLTLWQKCADAKVLWPGAGESTVRPREAWATGPPPRVLGLAHPQPGREARAAAKTITSEYLPCAFLDVSPQEREREFKEHVGHVTQGSSLSCPSGGRTSEALMWLHAPPAPTSGFLVLPGEEGAVPPTRPHILPENNCPAAVLSCRGGGWQRGLVSNGGGGGAPFRSGPLTKGKG